MYKDIIKDLLIKNEKKRILLYGNEGIGKTYFSNTLFFDIGGGMIIINFRNDDTSRIISALKSGMDITEALVSCYGLSEEMQGITFILDEFLETDHINGITELMTKKKPEYKYKGIRIIYITSDIAWAEENKARFDVTVKAGKVSFTEFLQAMGESFYAQVVDAHMTGKKSMPALIHNELVELYYQYISTGGYPRAIAELAKEDPVVFPEDLAAERYKTMIGNINIREPNCINAYNKLKIINTIPECAFNSKFIISKTGRRHIDKQSLENNIEDLVQDGILIKIPRLGSDSYSLALRDDAIYRYLLIKNSFILNMNEEKIKDLVIENHIRNVLHDIGVGSYTWSGKNRFRINVLIESAGKFYPIKVSCNKSKRKVKYDEFYKEYINCMSVPIQVTESSFNESKDSIYLPIYGCEYLKTIIPQL